MKMRKMTAMILALALTASLAACGGTPSGNTPSGSTPSGNTPDNSTPGTEAPVTQGQYKIRLSHANAPTTFNHDNVMFWKEKVEEYTNGAVVVEVFPSGQLMGVDEELPAILEGNIEACYIHGMIGENITDEYLIWGIPLLFGVGIESMDNIYEFYNSELYQSLVSGDFETAGYKAYIGFADCDHAIFTCNTPINSYSDLKGLRIRSHGGGFANDFISGFGGNPMTITSTELSTALMQGTVDGVETGKIYADKSAFPNLGYVYECASDYAGCGNAVVLSLDFYNSLPADLQAALDKAGAELTEWAKEQAKVRNDESLQNLQDAGMVYSKITDDDAQKMFADFWPTLEPALAENDELNQLFWYAYENYCPYDFGISK